MIADDRTPSEPDGWEAGYTSYLPTDVCPFCCEAYCVSCTAPKEDTVDQLV